MNDKPGAVPVPYDPILDEPCGTPFPGEHDAPTPPEWPLFVSAYTEAYRSHALELVASLDALGLSHDVRAMDDTGSWVGNCARKAAFCYERLAERHGKPIVWIDADARVRQAPTRFLDMAEAEINMAARWRDGQELLSGTLYLAGTRGLALAMAWVEACSAMPDRWDQRSLAVVLHMVPGLRIEVLPIEYTWIESFDAHVAPEPVIEHLQFSREVRRQEAGRS